MAPRKSFLGFKRGAIPDRRRAKRSASSDRRRVNRVKFRRRYAASRLKSVGEFTWIASRLAIVAAALVWGGGMAWHGWQDAEFLRVQGIRYEGDIPQRLPASIPIREGVGLFSFNANKLEGEAVRRFIELQDVSIGRGLDRTVVVRGRYRAPVAMLAAGVPTGIDAFGVAFPIPRGRAAAPGLPVIDAPAKERANAVACLGLWERKLPAFFSVVKKLECDRMRSFQIELSDGVVVDWGTLETAGAVEKAKKILRVMTSFSPAKAPARLRFVTEDRIVMDSAWKSREGGKIVKT